MADSKTGDYAKRGLEVIGAAAGAAAGLAAGDPSLGVLAATGGTFLGGVFGDMAARHISKMEARRLDTVAGEAARLIKENVAEGRELRGDGFFDEDINGRYRADEVVEAAFVAAMRSHEEKKIPHIAHLLAESGFASEVDGATINWALARAEELTWTQFVLLAAVGSDEYVLPDGDIGAGGSWERWGAHRQLADLGYGKGEFIAAPSRYTETSRLPYPDQSMRAHSLSNSGRLLYGLLGLELVDPSEVEAVLRVLAMPPTRPD